MIYIVDINTINSSILDESQHLSAFACSAVFMESMISLTDKQDKEEASCDSIIGPSFQMCKVQDWEYFKKAEDIESQHEAHSDERSEETSFTYSIVKATCEDGYKLFTCESWSKTIYPWLKESTTEERNNLISHISPAIKQKAVRVPDCWSGSYGSLARQTRWLRLAYRLPALIEARPAGVKRVWDSRLTISEGMAAVARLVHWVDWNQTDWEVESLAEALDGAEIPTPKDLFMEDNLNYKHMRHLVEEFLDRPRYWSGYEDFVHKFAYVSVARRILAFRQGVVGTDVEYWTKSVDMYEGLGMCRLLGLLGDSDVWSSTKMTYELSRVLRGCFEKEISDESDSPEPLE